MLSGKFVNGQMVEASPATVRNRNTTSDHTQNILLWWWSYLQPSHAASLTLDLMLPFSSYKHVTPKGLLTLRFVKEEGEKLRYSPSSPTQLGEQNLIKYETMIHYNSHLTCAPFPGTSMRIAWPSCPIPRYPEQRRVSFVDTMSQKKHFSRFTTD